MAKSKRGNQKPKPNKQTQKGKGKKEGKQYNIPEFNSFLDQMGLKIVQVTDDGNCFFRAIADQLEGNQEVHHKYRRMVVEYIKDNRLQFEPFVEDGVPFDEYCDLMEKDKEWAGQMELQACSLVTRSNICIHRLGLPRYYMTNFTGSGSRLVHLSYHNEVHYNSVRLKDDPGDGPAISVVIKADADLSAASNKGKAAATIHKGMSSKNVDTRSIEMVMSGGGCESFKRAEEVLQQVYGDVDAAIEFFIAEQHQQILGNDLVERNDLPSKIDAPDGDCGPPVVPQESTSGSKQTENKNDEKLTHANKSSQQSDKKLPRNPCGSKKKGNDCCVSVTKSPTVPVSNHKAGGRMSKKERKQAKKSGPVKVAPSSGSDGRIRPDVGALCI